MQRAFAASDSQIEWVVAAYILSFALCLLPFGRLGDIVGRQRMFLVGVAAFTIGSALCGLAPRIETLIAARVLQGVAGAMMTPQTLAIVPVLFPPHERGLAFSLFGLTAGLASVAGPMIGGLLIRPTSSGSAGGRSFSSTSRSGSLTVRRWRCASCRTCPAQPWLRNDFVGIGNRGAGAAAADRRR